jgi:hypothetical protein
MSGPRQITASVILFTLCAILVIQSVRSDFYCDEIQGRLTSHYSFALTSWRGRIIPNLMTFAGNSHQVVLSASSRRYDPSWQPATAWNIRGWFPAFVGQFMGWKTYGLIVPYWLLAVIAGTLAMALRLGWPPKFTLRGLLLAMTLLAIELSMTVTLDHSYVSPASQPTSR